MHRRLFLCLIAILAVRDIYCFPPSSSRLKKGSSLRAPILVNNHEQEKYNFNNFAAKPASIVASDHMSNVMQRSILKYIPFLRSIVDATVLGGLLSGGLHAITGK
jgi:hypothetical protein